MDAPFVENPEVPSVALVTPEVGQNTAVHARCFAAIRAASRRGLGGRSLGYRFDCFSCCNESFCLCRFGLPGSSASFVASPLSA